MTTDTADTTAITHDLYKDIHKAIRAELFDLTCSAGRLDPGDEPGRVALAARVDRTVRLLVLHAEHEDEHVQPSIERFLPRLAHRVADEHAALEARMLVLRSAADAAATSRARVHGLYLDLASFTGDYLAHQDLEEREIMPALCGELPLSDLLAINHAIVSSIPPQEMADSLALMLPAQNVEDRVALLGGMRASAPAEVFAGVMGLASTVLTSDDFADLSGRLGLVSAG